MANELAREIVAQARPRVRAVNGCITIKSTAAAGSRWDPVAGIKITAKCVDNEPEVQLQLHAAGQEHSPLKYHSIGSAINVVKAFIEARAGPHVTHSAILTSFAEDGRESPPWFKDRIHYDKNKPHDRNLRESIERLIYLLFDWQE